MISLGAWMDDLALLKVLEVVEGQQHAFIVAES